MSRIPLRWAVGDRCALQQGGRVIVGRLAAVDADGAVVCLPGGERIVCLRQDLDLVPLALGTLPAPALGGGR